MKATEHAIQIKNVSKKYRIYETPKERIKDVLGMRAKYKEFLALNDVSLNIGKGQFWGVVGKNGSGKSTLLKIIARQLQPSSGEVICDARITLLQLGLGFDPELSGIENIRLSRLAQNLKVDQEDVVEFVKQFSELGDFINFPVKTYSSGMHSRLAFATAIAGNPDVLIADEVLAVGDMNFSQKCLAKMREFKDAGKTVVLVTHDINAVKSFCNHAAWLNQGELISEGNAKAIAEDFRNFMLYGKVHRSLAGLGKDANSSTDAAKAISDPGADPTSVWRTPNVERRTVFSGVVHIDRYRFSSAETDESLRELTSGEPIALEMAFHVERPIDLHSFAFTIHDRHGMIAVHLNSEFFGQGTYPATPGVEYKCAFKFDVPMLASGDYSISLGCSEGIDGTLVEKYDYDTTVTIVPPRSEITERQGGYVIIPSGDFGFESNA